MTPLAVQLQSQLPTFGDKWWLGVSGGLDSICLLSLIKELQAAIPLPRIGVIHVNHGLQDQADTWQALVGEAAHTAGFEFRTRKVALPPTDISAQGLEAAARKARYQVFAEIVQEHQVLMLAHHADDQAETLLLRLLRGAGVKGLGGMHRKRLLNTNFGQIAGAMVFRPLLHISRQYLEEYAHGQGLTWVEDCSNANPTFDRNYIRNQVMPTLQARWPRLLQRTQTTSYIMQESQELLDDLAQLDYQTNSGAQTNHLLNTLRLDHLSTLTAARWTNLLRWWLEKLGELPPSYQQLRQIKQQMMHASEGAQPSIFLRQGRLLRQKDRLCWQLEDDPQINWEPAGFVWTEALQLAQTVEMASGQLVPGHGGLRLQIGDQLEARARVGGERCHPMGRRHSQTLKKLYQEYEVPRWLRQQLPLFYVNDQLAMVGHLWVCQGFAAPSSPSLPFLRKQKFTPPSTQRHNSEEAIGWQWQPQDVWGI